MKLSVLLMLLALSNFGISQDLLARNTNKGRGLFKAISGRVNGYSKLAKKGILYVIAISEGDDGRIFPLTKKNLIGIVADDPKAMKLLEKNKLLEAVEAYNKSAK